MIHLLSFSRLCNQIQLPSSLHNVCAFYISSCHPNSNKLLDTSLSISSPLSHLLRMSPEVSIILKVFPCMVQIALPLNSPPWLQGFFYAHTEFLAFSSSSSSVLPSRAFICLTAFCDFFLMCENSICSVFHGSAEIKQKPSLSLFEAALVSRKFKTQKIFH